MTGAFALAKDALHAAHDSFKYLVTNSPFGIYAVDSDFRLSIISQGAQKTFSTVHPLIGRNFAEILRQLWPEPLASEAIGHFRRTLATGAAYHAPSAVERRQDRKEIEAYGWKIERVVLPDGRPGVVYHFLRHVGTSALRIPSARQRGAFPRHIRQHGRRYRPCRAGQKMAAVNGKLYATLGFSQVALANLTLHDVSHAGDLKRELDLLHQVHEGSIDAICAKMACRSGAT